MLKEANFIKSIISTAEVADFLVGKNLAWDETEGSFKVNKRVFKKNIAAYAIIVGLHLFHFTSTESHQQSPITDNINQEDVIQAFLILALFFLIHICFLILQAQQELEDFVGLAYNFENANDAELKKVVSHPKIKRLLCIFNALIRAFKYGGNGISPYILTTSSFLLPSTPLNILSLKPGNHLIQFIIESIRNQHYFLGRCTEIVLTLSTNWIVWVLMMKMGFLIITQLWIFSVTLFIYMSLIKR